MTTNQFAGEKGRHLTDSTAEHMHDGRERGLDFNVWAYEHEGGWTVVAQQMPPEPQLDALGVAGVPPIKWVLRVSPDREITYKQDESEEDVDDRADRVPFDLLPDFVREAAWDAAGTGWWWDDVEHRYDLSSGQWVAA